MPSQKRSATKQRKTLKPQLLRGMRDILPADSLAWRHVMNVIDRIGQTYGFQFIFPPIAERTSLFQRSLGSATDVVSKEMYSFVDQGGDHISLRPEFTAGIARSYIEHGMLNLPQPVKLMTSGPCFRHERPQAGRFRQFWQFGFETIGDAQPLVDAELIVLSAAIYQSLGIDVVVQINSIGTPHSRERYKDVLLDYYKTKKRQLCADCQKRLTKNPLRVLDCKVPTCQQITQEAPQIIDYLDEESREHFVHVLEYLDESEITYALNPHLVRGLDYYTRTVFEVWAADDEAGQNALLAGGRYDGLIEYLGGRSTPACGMAVGLDRTVAKLQALHLDLPVEVIDVFVAQLGESARKKALRLFEDLRRAGFAVSQQFTKNGLKPQLAMAAKLQAKFVVILGQKEIIDRTVIIRDMENGAQEIVDARKIVKELERRLERAANSSRPTNVPEEIMEPPSGELAVEESLPVEEIGEDLKDESEA
jgi:histidyl-tRNA synthetase